MLLTIWDDDRLSMFIFHPLHGAEANLGVFILLFFKKKNKKSKKTSKYSTSGILTSFIAPILFGSFPNIQEKYVNLLTSTSFTSITYSLLMYISRGDSN